jgi:hypothetical protein
MQHFLIMKLLATAHSKNQTLREKGTESGGSFEKMAELPKVEPAVGSAFLFYKLKNNSIGERKPKYFKELPW